MRMAKESPRLHTVSSPRVSFRRHSVTVVPEVGASSLCMTSSSCRKALRAAALRVSLSALPLHSLAMISTT